MIRPTLFLLALLPLAGCAGDTRPYPSLAPRAAEKQGFGEPAVAAVAVVADPALDARIAGQGADLDRITAGFTAAAVTARRSTGAANRQPVGSEAWLTAQAAVARVDDWRAQATALAADIEGAGSTRAGQLQPAYPPLEALTARAAAETAREAQVVEQLQASLPSA